MAVELTTAGASIGLLIELLKLVLGLGLAIASIYIGLSLFGRVTRGIDEQEELRKGNVAVAVLQVAIILAIATVVQKGIENMTNAVTADTLADPGRLLGPLAGGVIQVFISLCAAIVVIYMAINILDRITKGIDEMSELKKGNVAVAVLMAGVLYAISFVVTSGTTGLGKALSDLINSLV